MKTFPSSPDFHPPSFQHQRELILSLACMSSQTYYKYRLFLAFSTSISTLYTKSNFLFLHLTMCMHLMKEWSIWQRCLSLESFMYYGLGGKIVYLSTAEVSVVNSCGQVQADTSHSQSSLTFSSELRTTR